MESSLWFKSVNMTFSTNGNNWAANGQTGRTHATYIIINALVSLLMYFLKKDFADPYPRD